MGRAAEQNVLVSGPFVAHAAKLGITNSVNISAGFICLPPDFVIAGRLFRSLGVPAGLLELADRQQDPAYDSEAGSESGPDT